MIAFGVRPWTDVAYFYALMAAMLATLVGLTVASEFIRGGRVISRHTGQNLLTSMVHLFHRNTRRYGGYIVHFGVAVVIIGILGAPFNQDKEKEMGFGDKITIGPYTLVESYTRTTIRITATVGHHQRLQGRSRSTPYIPSGAFTRPASSRRPCPEFAPPIKKIFT
jgi:cytochrome c biogenesis factor